MKIASIKGKIRIDGQVPVTVSSLGLVSAIQCHDCLAAGDV